MNDKIKKIVIVAGLSVILIGIYFLAYHAESITFEDDNLESGIRELINKPSGNLTLSDINDIQELVIRGREIRSLKGIENLTNLVVLDLRDNLITDITPLESLQQLAELDLRDNNIEDISSIRELRNLVDLNLRNNQIVDITSIGHLSHLTDLNIRDNLIEDISPLRYLDRLEDVNLRNNLITDISPLAELENLRKRVYIEGNPIQDTTPLEDIFDQIDEKDFEVGIQPPLFSQEGGFYFENFYLELDSGVKDGTIFYTLDGSEPDPIHNSASTYEYSSPIYIHSRENDPNIFSNISTNYISEFRSWNEPAGTVKKANVIKAVTYYSDQIHSEIKTHTYFIGIDHHFPVISISTNSENLFDDEIGIYVPGIHYNSNAANPDETGNYYMRGNEWERPIYLEYFNEEGSLEFSQGMGVRIHGNFSRRFPQKTLRLYARNTYGQSRIEYPLFDNGQNQFKRVLLRQSGNDLGRTHFNDALMQSLIADTQLETQAFKPSVVYINGEYWGIHNMRERYDSHYFQTYYDIDRENIVILSNNSLLDTGEPGDELHYIEMLDYIKDNNIKDDEIFEHVASIMDMDNYITYQVSQIYFRNTDWPANNIKFWRTKNPTYSSEVDDGKWRWMVYDLDHGFGFHGNDAYTHNTLQYATRNNHWSTLLFRSLLENDSFKEKFITRFADMLNTNFREEVVLETISRFYQMYELEMQDQVLRWNSPRSMDIWASNVDRMRDFAEKRPNYVREHLKNHFGLGDIIELKIDTRYLQGTIIVNNMEIDIESLGIEDGIWSGKYFEDMEISLSVIPQEGYKFLGWGAEMDTKLHTLDIVMTDNINLLPMFEKV